MSRLKNFTFSLASGYVQTGVNVLYTLASVPLALHYLTAKQFALWQVAISVSGYLLLIDFGMTDSTARILMDHKDNPRDGIYGSVIKIGAGVFLIQGLLIAIAGLILSFWMPTFANLQSQFSTPVELAAASRDIIYLTAGQCALQGMFFPTRIFSNLAVAHQRYDFYNYAQIAGLICNFAALWISFHKGIGVYSILVAGATAQIVIAFLGWLFVSRAGFLPADGCWGTFDRRLFHEIFAFGGNLFLMSLGGQLVNASQVLIISNTLGLEAAAVWAVATKTFLLAQQLVGRILTFACSPLCEMIVRNERSRFVQRFRDLIVISAAAAIFVGGGIAVCNESFLDVWLRNREILPAIHRDWNSWNDLLLALWLVVTTVTANHVTAVGFLKRIGRMRYVYFCEGLLFVTAAVLLSPRLGISGVIVASILANTLCSGVFGVRRTVMEFQVRAREVVFGWLAGPLRYLFIFGLVLCGCGFATSSFGAFTRLSTNATFAGCVGGWFLWKIALGEGMRNELRTFVRRFQSRLNFSGSVWQKSD